MQKKSFTLIEMIAVVMITGMIVPLIFFALTRAQRIKHEIDMQSELYYQTYTFLEKFNVRIQDYTIDYEEYFNRRMVGCSLSTLQGEKFLWQTHKDGHCDLFTAYGNQNSLSHWGVDKNDHALWFCSSCDASPYIPCNPMG